MLSEQCGSERGVLWWVEAGGIDLGAKIGELSPAAFTSWVTDYLQLLADLSDVTQTNVVDENEPTDPTQSVVGGHVYQLVVLSHTADGHEVPVAAAPLERDRNYRGVSRALLCALGTRLGEPEGLTAERA